MKNKVLLIAIFCIAVAILCHPAYASGIGIAPSAIDISDAIRGDIYEKEIRIHNPNDENLNFVIESNEEAGEWISFFDTDDNSPLTEGIVPANNIKVIHLKVEIPSDTPNGRYNASICASTNSKDNDNTMGIQAEFSAISHLTIEVTDIQKLSGTVEYISIHDGEVNLPVLIGVKFTNTGNVAAKPVVSIVMKKDGTTIDQMTVDNTEIGTGSSGTIQTEWDTTGQKSGKYTADVSVSLDGNILKRKTVAFELFPIGTLTQEGEFVTITSDGQLHPGTILKVIGTFRNTGEMGTMVKMVGEVVRNGNLIQTIESDELLVPMYQSKQLSSYLDLSDVGDYVVTAHMIYAGKETDEKELAFTVSEASDEPDSSDGVQVVLPKDTHTPLSIITVTSGVLIAGLFYIALRNKE